MPINERPALRKAAEIIAADAKDRALKIGKKTHTGAIARSIKVTILAAYGRASISAGGDEAPEARMFETPRARHPLFGNDKHWYYQPYRPFLEEAAEAKADEAMQAYADEIIPQILKDSGL